MLELLYHHISYFGIIFVLVISGTGLPIPEEIPVLLAGIASHAGTLNPWLAYLSCVVGSLAGDLILYLVGYHFGYSVLRDHPWYARFVKPEREQRIELVIRQHGLKVFFLARFLVGIRSPVFLTAGILRVSLVRFVLADILAATAVIGLFFSLGFHFADRILSWFDWIRGVEVSLTVAVVVGVAALALLYIRRRRLRWQRARQRRQNRSATVTAQLPRDAEPRVQPLAAPAVNPESTL